MTNTNDKYNYQIGATTIFMSKKLKTGQKEYLRAMLMANDFQRMPMLAEIS
jgi:hypothetical protein